MSEVGITITQEFRKISESVVTAILTDQLVKRNFNAVFTMLPACGNNLIANDVYDSAAFEIFAYTDAQCAVNSDRLHTAGVNPVNNAKVFLIPR